LRCLAPHFCLFGIRDRLKGDSFDENAEHTFLDIFLDCEVGLSVDLSIVFSAGLIKFEANKLIVFPLDFSNVSDGSPFVLDIFCVDDDLLADLVALGHS